MGERTFGPCHQLTASALSIDLYGQANSRQAMQDSQTQGTVGYINGDDADGHYGFNGS